MRATGIRDRGDSGRPARHLIGGEQLLLPGLRLGRGYPDLDPDLGRDLHAHADGFAVRHAQNPVAASSAWPNVWP